MKKSNRLHVFLRLMVAACGLALLPMDAFAQTSYFAGPYAGSSNTTGIRNTFVGSHAGNKNTTGSRNSFMGDYAGYRTTVGYENSFFGGAAGQENTIGIQNTFVGYKSGFKNKTGSGNTFLGTGTGFWNTGGTRNVFIGYWAGLYNTTGYYNIFLGVEAGKDNTTGYSNTFVGYRAGYKSTDGTSNAFLGYQSGYSNASGKNNVFLGRSTGANNVDGNNNVSLGSFSGPASGNLSNATAIGYRAFVSTSDALVLGSVNGVNSATANTKVGIGTTAPAYLLHVNGTAGKPGTSTWTVASDKRLKQDITPFEDGLAVVQQIRPVWFAYNGKAGMPAGKRYVGVIAQDIQQAAPYTVGQFTYQDTTGKTEQYLDYDANALTYLLVNAVQEQQQQVEQKDARIAALETQVATLARELSAIRAMLDRPMLPLPGTEGGGVARLWQNQPNPTSGTTLIRYYIPEGATSAQLKVFTADGREMGSYNITGRGEGQFTLPVDRLDSGTYLYHLVVDNQPTAAKKLVLTR
ncbi:MAG: tail fiber domain-containing protein [Cytophagales bacterium]|nr:tail fiber domain-containing protein [Cytophagales bacterium]